MPATTPNPSRQRDFKPSRFISGKLNADQKEMMVEWSEGVSLSDLEVWTKDALDEHYILTLKESEGGYQCSLTPQTNGSKHKNEGLVLVARASTPLKARMGLFYRHCEMYDKDWTALPTAQETEW